MWEYLWKCLPYVAIAVALAFGLFGYHLYRAYRIVSKATDEGTHLPIGFGH